MPQKQEHQKKIPKLRFREFQGEWNSIPGGTIFDSISDKKHNSDLPILAITQDKGAIPRDLIDFNISVTDKSVEGYKVVRKGDFIISLRSFQGGIEYSEYEGICSPAYIILRPNTKITDYFFKCLFKTDRYITEMNRKLEGIRDGKMVSYTNFSEININYPSLPEQEKIASFLSTIDRKIEKMRKKMRLFEEIKRFLSIRFFREKRGFFNKPWQCYLLANLLIEKNNKTLINGEYPILSSSNKGIFLQEDYFNKKVASENTVGYKIIKKGMFTYRSMSDTGEFTFNIQNIVDNGLVSPAYPIFGIIEGFSDGFIYYAMNLSEDFKKSIIHHKQGGTRYALHYSKLITLKLEIPSLPEQEKIASFLSEIDKKINAINIEIENTEKWKKGLLQRMFI